MRMWTRTSRRARFPRRSARASRSRRAPQRRRALCERVGGRRVQLVRSAGARARRRRRALRHREMASCVERQQSVQPRIHLVLHGVGHLLLGRNADRARDGALPMVSVTRRRMLMGGTAAGVVSSCGFAEALGFGARAAVAAEPTDATVRSTAGDAGAPATAAVEAAAARMCTAPRIVVLDWPLTEIVLSLGVVPVGVSRPVWYTRLDGVPPLPPSAVDTGLLDQPNFEVIETLKPDLIVVTPAHAPMRTLLERIAPTLAVPLYVGGGGGGSAPIDVYEAVRN